MEQQIFLVGIKLDELLTKIEAIVDSKLSKSSHIADNGTTSAKYLSRAEVSKLLKISLPTLHQWTKTQLLRSYKIGNRVLYRQQELEDAIVQGCCAKNKRRAL